MADYNRGIMRFQNADRPVTIAISAAVVATVVGSLVYWALTSAYAL